jgi:hypothetical protein
MQISLSYNELEQWLLVHQKKKLSVGFIGSKTINATVAFRLFSLSVKFSVEKILGTDITLSYEGNMAVNAISGSDIVRKIVSEKIIGNHVVTFTEGRQIIIHLANIEKLRNVFEVVNIEDIYFNSESINLLLNLK